MLYSHFILYIDPGIGSLAAQVIIAGFAAFVMFFKNGFKRFFFRGNNEQKESKEKISK